MVVVGAGPAGAALARQLVAQGVEVVLVEAAERPDRRFRGEALMPSGLEALRRMGLWPLPADIPRRPLRGWSFELDGQHLFEVPEPLGGGDPCTLIDQPALLRHLLTEAGGDPGFRLLCPAQVTGLHTEEQGGGIRGVELADGGPLAAGLVVACDGRGSLLREQAGLPLHRCPTATEVLWFAFGGPAAASLLAWIDGRFVTVVGAEGAFALFPGSDGTVRLGWLDDRRGTSTVGRHDDWRERWARSSPAELASLLRALPANRIPGPRRFPVQVGCAPRWWRPGLLLLGDAAHPMSPLRAQGINMALRDAVVAAETIAPALGLGGGAPLTAALGRVEQLRLGEIRAIQRLQQREQRRADLLRNQGMLRGLLAASRSWSGPLLARRWVGEQHHLHHGWPLPAPA